VAYDDHGNVLVPQKVLHPLDALQVQVVRRLILYTHTHTHTHTQYICIYIYIYIYIYRMSQTHTRMHVYTDIHIHTHMLISIVCLSVAARSSVYIYIYIYTERERERVRERSIHAPRCTKILGSVRYIFYTVRRIIYIWRTIYIYGGFIDVCTSSKMLGSVRRILPSPMRIFQPPEKDAT
jgi:hypothetical protein